MQTEIQSTVANAARAYTYYLSRVYIHTDGCPETDDGMHYHDGAIEAYYRAQIEEVREWLRPERIAEAEQALADAHAIWEAAGAHQRAIADWLDENQTQDYLRMAICHWGGGVSLATALRRGQYAVDTVCAALRRIQPAPRSQRHARVIGPVSP